MPSPSSPRDWVEFYKRKGYQPLPSDSRPGAKKKPLVKFADWWESPAPDDLWSKTPSRNIQVMTGVYWRLGVLDFDGPEAIEHAEKTWKPLPKTWVTSTGGGGKHVWFTLPEGMPSRRKTILWAIWEPEANEGKGEWAKHKAIEFLCDRSLVMAPPSIHPTTRITYKFQPGCSPLDVRSPAMIPQWILDLPTLARPKEDVPPRELPAKWTPRPGAPRKRVDYRDVLDAIPDKSAVAAAWGLRFADQSSRSNGWVSVHDFNRDDRSPSARFNIETGQFWRPGEQKISLFELGVALAGFNDWVHAKDTLADQFCV